MFYEDLLTQSIQRKTNKEIIYDKQCSEFLTQTTCGFSVNKIMDIVFYNKGKGSQGKKDNSYKFGS